MLLFIEFSSSSTESFDWESAFFEVAGIEMLLLEVFLVKGSFGGKCLKAIFVLCVEGVEICADLGCFGGGVDFESTNFAITDGENFESFGTEGLDGSILTFFNELLKFFLFKKNLF